MTRTKLASVEVMFSDEVMWLFATCDVYVMSFHVMSFDEL